MADFFVIGHFIEALFSPLIPFFVAVEGDGSGVGSNPDDEYDNKIEFFRKKGVRVTERRCTGRLHPFWRVTRVTGG